MKKIAKFALAAVLALGSIDLAAAGAAQAAPYGHGRDACARWDHGRCVGRGHAGRYYHSRRHQVRVCNTVWRHHHRVRVCRMVWR